MRSFKSLAVLIAATALTVSADDMDFLKRSQSVLKELEGSEAPEWLMPSEVKLSKYRDDVRSISIRSKKALEKNMGVQMAESGIEGPVSSGKRMVFVSFSIPVTELKVILEEAGRQNVVVAFRGLPRGIKTLPEMIRAMHSLSETISTKPEVILDPESFTQFKVTKAPTYILKEKNQVTRALGAVSFSYLERRSQETSDDLDLGVKGNVWDIEEKDFVEEMKQRMAGIDFKNKAQDAYSNFWSNRTFHELPKATKDRSFSISPAYKVTRNIRLPKGSLPFEKGQVVNPLDHFDFNQMLIIFDATDPLQVKFAQQQIDDNPFAMEKLIATKLDGEKGWDELARLENGFNRKVFMLDKNFASKFKIEHVPSTVHSDGKKFIVNEFGPKRLQLLNGGQ